VAVVPLLASIAGDMFETGIVPLNKPIVSGVSLEPLILTGATKAVEGTVTRGDINRKSCLVLAVAWARTHCIGCLLAIYRHPVVIRCNLCLIRTVAAADRKWLASRCGVSKHTLIISLCFGAYVRSAARMHKIRRR